LRRHSDGKIFVIARHSSFLAALAALAAVSAPAAAAPGVGEPGGRRPNIVFFLCDDLGTGDVAALGSKQIRTPNIDGLFARGTALARHWAGNAVCAPSRCTLMTGRHPGHAVVRSNREVKPEGQAPMPAGTVTLAAILRDAGYATGGFGKWGLGAPGSASDPQACGFDEFFGYNCQRQAHSFYPDHLWDGRQRVDLDGKTYSADLIAERQRAFVRRHADRPFFLYVPTTVPHLALEVPADEPSLPEYARQFAGEEPYTGGKGYVPCPRPLATYAAMVTRMDREVGRLVALLGELGIADDTIFVFSSDNGATSPGVGGIDTRRMGSHGNLREWKGTPYEGGLRVPTVAVWPGRIPAGRSIDAPTGFEDWLPTLLDLAGLADRIPPGLDGVSLSGPLTGRGAAAADRTLYRELTEANWQAAVQGTWKVVRRAGSRQATAPLPTELYDLAGDPGETTNVAAEQPDVIRRLEAILAREHVPHPDWPLPLVDGRESAQAESGGGKATGHNAPRRPSVLVIVSDDQRADTIHGLGNPHLETPAVDALVARGAVCDRAYCMGSLQGAVCVPSRAMMLSGRSLFHVEEQLRHSDTWPEAFARAGYRTFLTGKWHNGPASATRCFAAGRAVFLGGMHDPRDMPVVSFSDHGEAVPSPSAGTHASALFGDAAVEFVTSLGDEPFFAWVAFTAPHDPRRPPDGLRERFAGREPPPPANFLPEHPFDNGELRIRDEKLLGWPRTREAISRELADYYACIEGMDGQIGRIVAALAKKGRLDDTVILFTSDHGLAIGSHGLLGKQNLYEHSMRSPAVIAGPGVPAGVRSSGLCYLHDLVATVGDLAGVAPPQESDARSLLPLLRGEVPAVREELLLAYGSVQRALVTPAWKLIAYPAAGRMQLFDVATDPDELVDRSADPGAGERRTDLEARLGAAQRAYDDPLLEGGPRRRRPPPPPPPRRKAG
jgi:arylsulfatase A-like enzyme